MRTPSDIVAALQWWRDALAGLKPQITHEAQCGWFKRRLVRGGPYVAARIYLHQEIDPATGELTEPEELRCEVDGRKRDPQEEWTYLCYRPITEGEHNFMVANAEWARKYALGEPVAHPERPVNYNTIPLNF